MPTGRKKTWAPNLSDEPVKFRRNGPAKACWGNVRESVRTAGEAGELTLAKRTPSQTGVSPAATGRAHGS